MLATSSSLYLKKILRLLFSSFLGVILIVSITFLIAWRSGELLSFREVVQYQLEQNSLYGPCLQSLYQPYRKALYTARKPDILAIGSSRAGSFREEFFSKSFVTVAQAARDIDQTHQFLTELLKIHKPKMIILTVDFWWLNPNNTQGKPGYSDGEETNFTFAKSGFILDLFLKNKIALGDIYRALSNDKSTPWNAQACIGLQVLTIGTGARPDGSILYGEAALKGIYQDGKFLYPLSLIKKGTGNYEHSQIFDKDKLRKLQSIIDWINKEGIILVVIIPPVAPTIYRAMKQTGKYEFIEKFEEELKKYNFFFCFQDPETISTTDQEFSDGCHGGEVTYARILKRIVKEKGSVIKGYINEKNVEFAIQKFKNHILVKFPKDQYLVDERPYIGKGTT